MVTTETQDAWERRLQTLRPGWRGRLRIAVADAGNRDATVDVVGTVVAEGSQVADPYSDAPQEAVLVFCTNYRHGEFVAATDQPRLSIDLGQIRAADPM